MSVETAAVPRARGGAAVLFDVIVAPKEAFAALRERPTWVWAFVAVCVLGIAGSYLLLGAEDHVVRATFATNPTHDPKIASLSPGQRDQIVGFTLLWQQVATFLYPLGAIVAILYGTLVCMVANAAAKGDGTFGRLFGFMANVALVRLGLGALVAGALAALRGPSAFLTPRDLQAVLPSLAWLVPAGNPKFAAFLADFNPFQIWTFVLVGIGLPLVARIGRTPAFIAAAVLVLTEAAIGVIAAK